MPPIADWMTSSTSPTVEPVAGRRLAVDLEVEVVAAHHPLGVGRERARERLDHRLDLLAELLELGEVGTARS